MAAWRSLSISSLRLEVLLDVGVGAGQVRLGLVVVEVADVVLDGVVREELAELRVQLGSQRLVVRQDQGGLLMRLDRLGDRECLAGSGRAQQRLMAQAFGQAFAQFIDRLGLVAGGLEVGNEPKVGHRNLVGVGAPVYCRNPE